MIRENGTKKGLRLSCQQVQNCSFRAWYNALEQNDNRLETSKGKLTVASATLDLPVEFVNYLQRDGVVLPEIPFGLEAHPFDPRIKKMAPEETYDTFGDIDWDDDEGDGDNKQDGSCEEEENSEVEAGTIIFEELERGINQVLEVVKECFIKLNWTSPSDAGWVAGTLKCCSAGDIFMLLKTSDFVQHDLNHAFDNCFDRDSTFSENNCSYHLVMRRWSNLNKAMEFRCFVYGRALVAVTQRFPQTFYEFILPENEGESIKHQIDDFFHKNLIAEKFPDPNFVFDVYIDRSQRVWLVDFSPLPEFVHFSDNTEPREEECSRALEEVPPHPLLSWSELHRLVDESEDQPVYLTVNSELEASSMGDVTRSHRVPIELVTGELTHDIVNEAKAQLERFSALDE